MSDGFKDHFSAHSESYRAYRPTYPAELFQYLVSLVDDPVLAWDAATGNGQVAISLASYFPEVIASDASESQIAAAAAHPRVSYRVRRAEQSGLLRDSLDLITVAQAFHWFEEAAFFAEAQRVLKPAGVLAIWCYQLSRVVPECDVIIDELYDGILAGYWLAERELVEAGYAGTTLPGEAIDTPSFNMSLNWHVEDMLGYLRTWSACKRYEASRGSDPVLLIETALTEAWGSETRRVEWPLQLMVSRLE